METINTTDRVDTKDIDSYVDESSTNASDNGELLFLPELIFPILQGLSCITCQVGYQGSHLVNAWYAVDKWTTKKNVIHCQILSEKCAFNSGTLTFESTIRKLTCTVIESKKDPIYIQ